VTVTNAVVAAAASLLLGSREAELAVVRSLGNSDDMADGVDVERACRMPRVGASATPSPPAVGELGNS
jgi:hypothetical protein